MRLKKIQEIKSYEVLECTELDNDIIFRKYHIKEGTKIRLRENQFLFLIENGRILDIEEEIGTYQIVSGDSEKEEIANVWKKILIRKSEEIPLSVIFLNRRIIRKNKYFLEEPIKYKDVYIKIKGNFDFYIVNPNNFFEKVIGLRKHFSKQELIEQIRKYVVKSIKKSIEELLAQYNFELYDIQNKAKELQLKLTENEFDKKIFEYGVKLNYFDIEQVDVLDKRYKFFKNRK